MKGFYSVLMSAFLVILMPHAYAADTTGDVPPAHKQKHAVPDSTSNGNYLESQEQGTTEGSRSESLKDGAVPTNAKEKSQRFKKEPEQGGTDVNQKQRQ
ncbi:hypothetical protein ACW4YW_12845 [Methylobacillus pratensis]